MSSHTHVETLGVAFKGSRMNVEMFGSRVFKKNIYIYLTYCSLEMHG